jgi:mRNA interferase RelE/StbE
MSYSILLHPHVLKFLDKLRDQSLKKRLENSIEALSLKPFPMGSKKLSGHDNSYRIRVGDYRIIYQVDQGVLTILVLTIGHRREVYR